jgi:hypothetical protein
MKRSIWLTLAVPAFLVGATLVAQILIQVPPTPSPAPRPKLGGISFAPAARAPQATGASVAVILSAAKDLCSYPGASPSRDSSSVRSSE